VLIDVTVMGGPPLFSFTNSPMLNDMQILQTYEIGAVVRLNGAPDTLLVAHDGPGAIVMFWPDRLGILQEHTFPILQSSI
jgi:hypothetical protein